MKKDDATLKNLSILKDEPLFSNGESLDGELDAFNHQAYAEALFKIIKENPPPLSVGLFGRWGIGKSTVVNILFRLVKDSSDSGLKPVYFNAWKYSRDSFRRQFLIEVARQIYEGHTDSDAKLLRLEQLNYADVLKDESKKNLIEQIKQVMQAKVRLREPGLARILLALVVLLVGGVIAAFAKSFYPFFSSAFAALLLFFLRLKFEDVFVIKENPVYDPKLIFPEQFEAEFRTLIGPEGPLGKSKAVIAIDDIDRCEPDLIRDILISVKTFVGQENCYFVVPCDDRTIVKVFEDPNQKEGYKDELLRKYFNLGVRMAPLMATDLVDFANSVSVRTGIPQEIVQMAILANCHDARKMKHFLNTFIAKYAIAKARQEKGLMPIDVDEHLVAFSKVVLLEDLYPELFERIVERPEIYPTLEKAALGEKVDADIKRFRLEHWAEDYPFLREVLERTRDTKVDQIELFVSLKTTNPEARIPRGHDLKNAILRGDRQLVDEIIKGLTDESARGSLGQLLVDLLGTSHFFLKNAISASLELYGKEGLILANDRPRVAKEVCYSLLHKEGQRVFQHGAPFVLRCAKDAGGRYPADIISKYEQELQELSAPPGSLAETVNALYVHSADRARLASQLNKKLEEWVTNEIALSTLVQLQLPGDLNPNERVPSAGIVQKVASAVAADAAESTIRMNELRRDVVFKFWDDEFAPVVAERLVGILQQSAQSETADSPRNAFVIGAILENPSCLEPKFTQQIWPQIQQVFNRTKEWNYQLEAHKVIILLAASAPDSSVKNAAQAFVTQNWQSFSDKQLRDALKYMNRLEEPRRTELKRILLQQELTLAQGEMQNPSDRTKERFKLCYENKRVVEENPLKQFLLKTLDTLYQ